MDRSITIYYPLSENKSVEFEIEISLIKFSDSREFEYHVKLEWKYLVLHVENSQFHTYQGLLLKVSLLPRPFRRALNKELTLSSDTEAQTKFKGSFRDRSKRFTGVENFV